MANTVQIQGQIQINDGIGAKQLNRNVQLTPTGTKFFSGVQSVGTAAEALAVSDCATLRYLGLCNPPANTATVTVTVTTFDLKPGDVAIFPPGSINVTLQSTATATDLATAGTEA